MTLVVNTLILDHTAWDLEPRELASTQSDANATSRLTR